MPRLPISSSSSSNLGLPPPHLSSSYLQFRRITVLPTSSNSVANASSSAASMVFTRERGKNTKLISALMLIFGLCGQLENGFLKHVSAKDQEVGKTQNQYSILEKIEQPLKQYLNVAFAPSKATGKVLASELPKHGNERCIVRYPASAKASFEIEEGLSKRGFKVYVDQVDQMALRQALTTPVVAVASPSALRIGKNLIPELERWGNAVACIGETTALAAKGLALRNVYYPTDPGLDGWVDSIVEALKGHKQVQKV